MRISKTVGSTTTKYYYIGSQLVAMTQGDNSLYFTYDAVGVSSVNYNGTQYYYTRSAQGNIISIVNSSGTAVVNYTYDAWGRITNITGSMKNTLGAINPLRYRGYVYDTETGLYYLQTRYYNPVMCRFISADGYTTTGQGELGGNMFAYCGNNPVNYVDPTGEINWRGLIAGVAIVAVGVALLVVTGATMGAATPMVAAVATTIASTVANSLIYTGVTIASGAATESPVVVDVSVTNGCNKKSGYSLVMDFDSTSVSFENYYHAGSTTSGSSVTYGAGPVYNYEGPGDYGGYFADISATYSYHGVDYGVDYCTDPSNPFAGCSALLITTGVSFPLTSNGKIGGSLGVDYYVSLSYTKIAWD